MTVRAALESTIAEMKRVSAEIEISHTIPVNCTYGPVALDSCKGIFTDDPTSGSNSLIGSWLPSIFYRFILPPDLDIPSAYSRSIRNHPAIRDERSRGSWGLSSIGTESYAKHF